MSAVLIRVGSRRVSLPSFVSLLVLLSCGSLLVHMPDGVAPASATCADTVLVRAAKTYSISGSSPVTFYEPCTLTPVPGRRFLIEVLRPGSSNSLTSARVAYAGVEYFGTGDITTTDELLSRSVSPQGTAYLKVTLEGGTGGRIVVRATQVPEPMYVVYSSGNLLASSSNTSSKTYTRLFSPANGPAAAPRTLVLTNGAADSTGSARTNDTEVYLNGNSVILPGEVTTGRAFITRNVSLEEENTLQVTIPAWNAGKRVSIQVSGTDDSAPAVSVAEPIDSVVTTAGSIAASVLAVD